MLKWGDEMSGPISTKTLTWKAVVSGLASANMICFC